MIGKNSMKHHYLKKKDLYSNLNMEDINDADYAHAKGVCKNFEIKQLGKYHNLYVQRDTLLLADVFENLCVIKYINLIQQNLFWLLD